MSYCTLDEAWGEQLKCSRTSNSSGKKKNVSFNIKNELPCNNSTPYANDPIEDESIYYLPKTQNNKLTQHNNPPNYNLVNPQITHNTQDNYSSLNNNCNQYSYLNQTDSDECNMFSDYPQDGNNRKANKPTNNVNQDNLDIINSENFNDGPKPLNPYNDGYSTLDYLNSDDEDNIEEEEEPVYFQKNNNQLKMNELVESESQNLVNIEEGFQNNNNNIQDTQKMLLNILDRLDVLESKINSSKNKKNNVHDIILFIVIGIFVLFALDSVFRIGRLTV